MVSAYGLSVSFESRVRSKYIGHNTYTFIRSNLRSKIAQIHVPVHKQDSNYSYSRSHFSRLPQAVAKKIIYRLSQKGSNDSKIIDTVINGFSPNDISGHLHICYESMVTFGIK